MSSLNEMEKTEWEFERYERWQHTASLSALIANIFRDENNKKEPFTMEDYMPIGFPGKKKTESEKKQTWQEMLARVEAMNAAMGGADNRKGG